MSRGWRVLANSVVFFLLLAFILLVFLYRFLTESLTPMDGALHFSAVDKPVHVYRDSVGVPHIFAESEADLFRAAGYVIAQDRLWQMDFFRRLACGKLSEVLGSKAVELDKFARVIGFARIARDIEAKLSPQSSAVLQAYADGINAFIAQNGSTLPIEFALLGYEPEPWQVSDSIAFTRFMAWKLSFSWYVDLTLHELVRKFGAKKAAEVFPDFPGTGPFILSQDDSLLPSISTFVQAGMGMLDLLGSRGGRLGSNSWVVSGDRTSSGKPLLANDPHLELMTPSLWYEMHLSGGEIDAAGVSLPGVPGVVIGHNQRIAWGLTNGMVDDVDFYLERISPDSLARYWDGREWQDFKVVEEEIEVKDGPTVLLQVKSTGNGPVVSDLHPVVGDSGRVVSMRWVGQTPSDELSANLGIMQAQNWQDFVTALRDFKVPAQNFLFASDAGDIGYHLAGSVPVRHKATGILPHAGWKRQGRWLSEVPFDRLPNALNPKNGYLATANNKIVDDHYPYYISNLWEPPSRAERIHRLLGAGESFSVQDFKEMQLNVQSALAQEIMQVIHQTAAHKLDDPASRDWVSLFKLMREWDGTESPESVAPAIFHAFFVAATENTLKDEMGEELFNIYIRTGNVPFRVMVTLLSGSDSVWFDDISTAAVESKEDIVLRSLTDAGNILQKLVGDNISDWRWGKVHTLTMKHPLGRHESLAFLLNLGPYSVGGSTGTINSAEYRLAHPFDVVVGPSTRQIFDLSQPERSLSIITSGQSGQRMSEHYSDQTDDWLSGNYHTVHTNRELLAETAANHLTLVPQK